MPPVAIPLAVFPRAETERADPQADQPGRAPTLLREGGSVVPKEGGRRIEMRERRHELTGGSLEAPRRRRALAIAS